MGWDGTMCELQSPPEIPLALVAADLRGAAIKTLLSPAIRLKKHSYRQIVLAQYRYMDQATRSLIEEATFYVCSISA
nr:hypothetical protein CFP56_11005 [Quercus suber]